MKFTVISANSPVWANSSNSAITLNVQFEGFDEPVAFTASQNDCETHGKEIFNRAAAGEFGAVGLFVAPPAPPPTPAPTKEQLLAQLQALQAQIQALE